MLAEKLATLENVYAVRAIREPDIDSLVHDLRGPLSVIVAFAESMESAQREERALLSARLVANAHRALAVLEEFAALCDLRSGAVEVASRPLNLGDVVERAARDTVHGTRRGLELECLVDRDGVTMIGDRDLLGMAIRAVLRKLVVELSSAGPLRLQVCGEGDFTRVELRGLNAGGCVLDGAQIELCEMEILQRVVALHGGRVVFDGEDPSLVFRISMPRQARHA